MGIQSTAVTAKQARAVVISDIRAGNHAADPIYQDLSAKLDALIVAAADNGLRSVNFQIEADASLLVDDTDGALATAAAATIRQDIVDAGFDITMFQFEVPSMMYFDLSWGD